MMHILRRNKLALTATLAALLLTFVPAPLFAQSVEDVCNGVQIASGAAGCTEASAGGVNSVIATVINILSAVVGIVAVIMIIIGGFRYVTSGGDSNGINSAKNTIIYAIVGLIVVAMAQIIVRFVLARVTNQNG